MQNLWLLHWAYLLFLFPILSVLNLEPTLWRLRSVNINIRTQNSDMKKRDGAGGNDLHKKSRSLLDFSFLSSAGRVAVVCVSTLSFPPKVPSSRTYPPQIYILDLRSVYLLTTTIFQETVSSKKLGTSTSIYAWQSHPLAAKSAGFVGYARNVSKFRIDKYSLSSNSIFYDASFPFKTMNQHVWNTTNNTWYAWCVREWSDWLLVLCSSTFLFSTWDIPNSSEIKNMVFESETTEHRHLARGEELLLQLMIAPCLCSMLHCLVNKELNGTLLPSSLPQISILWKMLIMLLLIVAPFPHLFYDRHNENFRKYYVKKWLTYRTALGGLKAPWTLPSQGSLQQTAPLLLIS